MRIALLACVHGNLAAFEAVLDDAARAHADDVLIVGDLVGGPEDPEVVGLARKRRLTCLKGDAEHAAVRGGSHSLSSADARWIDALASSRRLAGPAGVLFARHGAPFAEPGARVVAGGHGHVVSVREHGGVLLVDCGSVGRADPGPEATYVIADLSGSEPEASVRSVPWTR